MKTPHEFEHPPGAGPASEEASEAPWPFQAPEARGRGAGHYAILLGLWLATLGVLMLGLWLEPDPRGFGTHEQLGFAPCQMLESTGVPCPACGITTSVTLAAQGEFARAWFVQPIGWLLAWLTPLLAILAAWQHRQAQDLAELWSRRRLPWIRIGLALGLAAWFYRMTL